MKIKLPKNPKPIEGFEIIEHKIQKSFDPEKMELWISKEQKSGRIEGNKLKEKLPDDVYNACVLEYLLKHQDLIPNDWRNYYPCFWGTIYEDLHGDRHVPYLYWIGRRWYLDFDWLDHDFISGARVVRPRKKEKIETLEKKCKECQFEKGHSFECSKYVGQEWEARKRCEVEPFNKPQAEWDKGKELFEIVYQWGRANIVVNYTAPTFQNELKHLISQKIKEARDEGYEAGLNLRKEYNDPDLIIKLTKQTQDNFKKQITYLIAEECNIARNEK